jgi:hypothetical protein
MHTLDLRNWHDHVFHGTERVREISKGESKSAISPDFSINGHHKDYHNMLRGCRSNGVSNCLCDNVELHDRVPEHTILH